MPEPPAELTRCSLPPALPSEADLDPAQPNWEAISVYLRRLMAAYEDCAYVVARSTRWMEETRTVINGSDKKE